MGFRGAVGRNEARRRAVTTDDSLVLKKKRAATRPEARRRAVTKTRSDPPQQFIRGIAKSRSSFREAFDDVRIETDGKVASVAFD